MRTHICRALLALVILAGAAPAYADATAFLGIAVEPDTRLTRGFAIGFGLVIIGYEFEYANVSEDLETGAPGLRTGMFNVLGQTIPINGIQLYATGGGGLFRETHNEESETNVAVNVGGGVKWKLAGPLRLRLDYRILRLKGDVIAPTVQRLYAGLNLAF